MLFELLAKNASLSVQIESEKALDLPALKFRLIEVEAIQTYLLSRGANDEYINEELKNIISEIINHQK